MSWLTPWKTKRPLPPKKRSSRRIILRPQGLHYNLKEILESLNEEYFDGLLPLPITWFGNPYRKVRSHLTLGSYHFDNRLIRINRLLDHPHFPDYFIEYVVYHEMLHSYVPPKRKRGGGHLFHHDAFKAKEREFRYYEEAIAWEKENRKIGLDYGRP